MVAPAFLAACAAPTDTLDGDSKSREACLDAFGDVGRALCEQRHRYQEAHTILEGAHSTARLRVGTLNLGLLDVGSPVPYYDARSEHLAPTLEILLEEERLDVLFLQEAWRDRDIETLAEVAERLGYWLAFEEPGEWSRFFSRDRSSHGLNVMVRRDALEVSPESLRMTRLHQDIFGTVDRVLLTVEATSPAGETLLLATTHLTAGASDSDIARREAAVEEIAISLDEGADGNALVLFGADLNLSPSVYFGDDDVDLEEKRRWHGTTRAYATFHRYTRGLFDADPERMALVDTHGVLEGPRSTQDREENPLTARSPSTRDEPDQRLDYVFVAARHGFRIVEGSLFATTEQPVRTRRGGTLRVGDEVLTLSDHFGVLTEIEWAPR